ncbi:class I SAM-dependent methyltransferase [Trichlorobacter sp.]|uniref:class I SAM-dependent DNA methyltransferase n=1 Tax=Trichlorobacter sp. TaxID=2911007 RepID=UPI002A36A93A|nr:class I SAM-dependent methyltransferase [Trichlorobacter sp.]MDY0383102.1 class I SAM-dependent methyltransferase [Trichlorobacter sp.]
MSVFVEYARYYDLLYRDKDYAGEAAYVHTIIQSCASGARSVLNLGCGSGRHDRCLAELGYEVTGVDISEEMLTAARNAAAVNPGLKYVHGDVRTVQLEKKFDVVISLFHVMSYQTTNADLMAAVATAADHMHSKSIFIFDCWYGPGVLTDRPTVRVKELEDEALAVTRIAQPVMHPSENVVDVNYRMFIKSKVNSEIHEICETHKMRYLFVPEIQLLLTGAGLELSRSEEWLTGARLGCASWNAVFVCRKRPA